MNTSHGPAAELRARIRATGPISFAEFHQVALYWPTDGYYTGTSPVGEHGDFYTAPLTHPVFGALVGEQLIQMWRLMGSPQPFWVLEPGAGSGRLALDVVSYITLRDPDFTKALHYVGIDIAPPASPLPDGVEWLQSSGLPMHELQGCILANELLDATPVHRVVQQHGRLCELLVGLDQHGAFAEVVGEPSTAALSQRFEDLGIKLPDGYRTEVNLGLEPWLRGVSDAMERGYVLLIDYGHEAATLYDDSRSQGSLRCYYRHTLNANPYQHVGRQDISAHVDFTSLRRAAISVGLAPLGYASQLEFLSNLGWAGHRDDIAQRSGLTPRVRQANLNAMDTLVDPAGMGQFKVMGLGKKVPAAPLLGFSHASATEDVMAAVRVLAPAPLATPGHMPLAPRGAEEIELPSWREMIR
jgi:SAM-dependent MidA family methyltransferase